MKKLLASLLAASTVLSLSAAAFAYNKVSGGAICDSDGDPVDAEKGATIEFDLDTVSYTHLKKAELFAAQPFYSTYITYSTYRF